MRLVDADELYEAIYKLPCQDILWHGLAKEAALRAVCDAPTVGGWISVKDRLPDSNHVLAQCEICSLDKPMSYTCVAFYAKKHSISIGKWADEEFDACDYDETTDEYYLNEGWYEVIHNWGDYSSVVIDDFVTHWMPLPEPPKEVDQ